MPALARRSPSVVGLALLICTFVAFPAAAQTAPEYRALWVDTFNTALGTRAEIDQVIAAAVDGNLNAIFAQVRRRGDSWYLDTLEPLTQVTGVGEPGASGTWTFDPLRYLIEQAHNRGIEVHAFVIVGSIYNAHPTITGLPADPAHVFNTHFWDGAAAKLYPVTDPRQWGTRALPHNSLISAGPPRVLTTFDGHRFASGEWYIDLGHPDAAAYTVDVLTHLVRRYDVDGIHLDRIRYPEAPIDKPGPSLATWGINVGYNETSVNRFKTRYGDTATYYTAADIGTNVSPYPAGSSAVISAADVGYPRTSDALWNAWRREQVTNFVRRLYLSATAVKPRIKVSAATICFWTGPTGSQGWERTEAYYRVFQDWRSWMQEGILDIAAPMIYKREHSATERPQYDDWLAFTKSLAVDSGRQAIAGLGAYINGVEGTFRQARRALARTPVTAGNAPAAGVIFYALGSTIVPTTANSTNVGVTNNPFAYPSAATTPKRSNADFFSGLRTSVGVDPTLLFEPLHYGSLFPTYVPVPEMPWKASPTVGHVMGFATQGNTPLDGAFVTVRSLGDPAAPPRVTRTDGGGFYGIVGLAPGAYNARVELGAVRLDVCRFDVHAGLVTTASTGSDREAPVTTARITPGTSTGQNGWYLEDVQVTLEATDDCSGVSATEYSIDGGTRWLPYTGTLAITAAGTTTVSYRSFDVAGNREAAGSVVVKIDKAAPVVALTATPGTIWPANGGMVPITLAGSAEDAAGVTGVTYAVVDEYGTSIAINPRALNGAVERWTDIVSLEARRHGADRDGRLYRIVATATDQAGRSASASANVIVLHDRR